MSKSQLAGMTYDPGNAHIRELQRLHGPNWKQHLAAQRGISPEQIVEKNAAMMDTIQKIAGAPTQDHLGDRMVSDLIKGAQANPRTGQIQVYQEQAEMKLASLGVTPFDMAHMVGTLTALEEGGFSKKEAAEYLNVGEDAIDAVLTVVQG